MQLQPGTDQTSSLPALWDLNRKAHRARGGICFSTVNGWRLGLSRGYGGFPGWHLSASRRPPGLAGAAEAAFLAEVLRALGADDSIEIPAQLEAGMVQHFGWGAGPEYAELFQRSLAAHASP